MKHDPTHKITHALFDAEQVTGANSRPLTRVGSVCFPVFMIFQAVAQFGR